MTSNAEVRITLFHCINSISEEAASDAAAGRPVSLKSVKLPCSGMVKDVFLLRAFEAGADAVLVLACPQGQCRYLEGNIRAKKRVEWVQGLLDQIGLDGRRLAIFNVPGGDSAAAAGIIAATLALLDEVGPNPAAN